MNDAAPRIFRSLERSSGQQEFDLVVTAAVAAYSSLRHPNPSQAEDLGRLVQPLWPRVAAETRRNAAAALSHTPRLPRVLVEALLAEPLEVAAPFLVSSPTLTGADIAGLAASPDERIVRLVRNRTNRPEAPAPRAALQIEAPLPAASLPALDDADVASPSLSADFLAITPLRGDEPSAPPLRTAETVRETLKRLAGAGRGRPTVAPASPEAAPTFTALLHHAMMRDEIAFYRTLRGIFGMPEATLRAIEADEEGERLAVSLKALKASSADAMSILMMMKPRIGLDVAAFDAMARFYKALRAEDCRAAIGAARAGALPEHRPLTSPERFDAAPQPRLEFGRRGARPAGREAKG
ncbi:hypothetical protein [Aureimonas pseudogalii]|uniref:DUF2336 domain-containing protein n=1 Tax=Aureimonas pseudogalii TaxID=1744844 RepID=A0A7W6H228_9HYPH|nr:hypothetical protein [Aureimonas pseudogalii]MBB3996586.1 hypothetical protein [Aureimonas pseudogalii]